MSNPLVPTDEDICEIEPNVYIGNLETACNTELLQKYKITKVLSVLQTTIADNFRLKDVVYKYINVWDTEHEDLISYFPESFQFIIDGQQKKESVFIHCRAGRSRSATIAMAFLMKKHGYSFKQAQQTVTVLRNESSPNPGFIRQLELWQKMAYQLVATEREYRLVLIGGLTTRMHLINKFGHQETMESCLQSLHTASLSYLQKVANAEASCPSMDRGKPYRCSSCSTELFHQLNVIESDGKQKTCSHIFIEPMQWVLQHILDSSTSVSEAMAADLNCGQCHQTLGSYNWDSRQNRCDCEAHKDLGYYTSIRLDSDKVATD